VAAGSAQLPEVRDKFVNVVALPASTTLEVSKLAVRAHFWKWKQSRYCRRADSDVVRGANRKLMKSIGAAAQPR
jgi:hypothetical protein